MFVSALHKLQFGPWWMGLAFWFPLHPPMTTTAEQLHAEATWATTYLILLSLAQYLLLGWQLAFPFMAWRRGCRPLLVGDGPIPTEAELAMTSVRDRILKALDLEEMG